MSILYLLVLLFREGVLVMFKSYFKLLFRKIRRFLYPVPCRIVLNQYCDDEYHTLRSDITLKYDGEVSSASSMPNHAYKAVGTTATGVKVTVEGHSNIVKITIEE